MLCRFSFGTGLTMRPSRCETCSPHPVRREADGAVRSGLTTIFFLLAGDGISRWHRVRSDEAWHHYEGDALELLSFSLYILVSFAKRDPR